MKGGFAGLAARYYYPQNMLTQDPQRDMTTSQIPMVKGGCGCGMKQPLLVKAEQPLVKGGSKSKQRKNHSRKYLKGGAGFFNNFGTTTGASEAASQITGASNNYLENQKPAFLA